MGRFLPLPNVSEGLRSSLRHFHGVQGGAKAGAAVHHGHADILQIISLVGAWLLLQLWQPAWNPHTAETQCHGRHPRSPRRMAAKRSSLGHRKPNTMGHHHDDLPQWRTEDDPDIVAAKEAAERREG